MGLRIATIEDFDLIFKMAQKFLSSTYIGKYSTEEKVREIITTFLNADRNEAIVILYDDVAMLAGVAKPFMFGTQKMASDFAWWVEPEARKSKIGKELLDAFEEWAHKVGCTLVSMVCLDTSVGTYYEKRGYSLYEYGYVKEIA